MFFLFTLRNQEVSHTGTEIEVIAHLIRRNKCQSAVSVLWAMIRMQCSVAKWLTTYDVDSAA